MDITIHAKNIDLNPRAEDYIQRKFRSIQRRVRNITDAKIEVQRTNARSSNDRIQAQMTLRVAGYTLRGQDSGANLFAAVDSVSNAVDRQGAEVQGEGLSYCAGQEGGQGNERHTAGRSGRSVRS